MYKAEEILNYKKSQIEKEKKDYNKVKEAHNVSNFINST